MEGGFGEAGAPGENGLSEVDALSEGRTGEENVPIKDGFREIKGRHGELSVHGSV